MLKIAPLTSRALLRLEGQDVVPFLQNLITCDVEGLAPGEAIFGALLTPQGKVLFDFIILAENDGFTFDIDRDQRDALAKRLTFYKLRADVQISNDQRNVFAGWSTTDAPGVETLPEQAFADPRHAGLGWRFYGSVSDSNSDEDAWHQNRIAQGIPQSGQDFELASLFPHDALMDQVQQGGIDFAKGCYVGQEVVSRMQHRGTARNRYVIVSAEEAFPEESSGQSLTADGKRVGTMGSVSGSTGLALVRIDRVGPALDSGIPILLGEVKLQVTIPAFASFGWPS